MPFVRVGRAWWDSHAQNFESHQEMVPELDHVMATLLDDLEERGLLRNTLVVTLAEFGRTPSINSTLGRDHFASAWSTTLSGCGIRGGSVYGRTDETRQSRRRRRDQRRPPVRDDLSGARHQPPRRTTTSALGRSR